jgi:hypothetical protein
VERIRRRPSHSEERERAARGAPPRREPPHVEALLDLQHAAGNRGVAAAFGGVVQRQPKGGKNDGGVLTLGSEEIPIQAATWSIKLGVAQENVGRSRETTIHSTAKDSGSIAITRHRDDHSNRLMELFGTEFDEATIRLDRPSRDGVLPAATLKMSDVGISSFGGARDEDQPERVQLYVGDLAVAGLGREDEAKPSKAEVARGATAWSIRVDPGGGESWPSIPVISASIDQAKAEEVIEAGTVKHLPTSGPPRVTVHLVAGMALTRLSKALDEGRRLQVTLSVQDQTAFELTGALVEKIESTGGGANVVEVGFVGEQSRRTATKAPSRR